MNSIFKSYSKLVLILALSFNSFAGEKITLAELMRKDLVDTDKIESAFKQVESRDISPIEKRHTLEMIKNNIDVIQSALDNPKAFLRDGRMIELEYEATSTLFKSVVALSYATGTAFTIDAFVKLAKGKNKTATQVNSLRRSAVIGSTIKIVTLLYLVHYTGKREREAIEKTYDLKLTDSEYQEFSETLEEMKDLLFEYNEMIKEELGLEQY